VLQSSIYTELRLLQPDRSTSGRYYWCISLKSIILLFVILRLYKGTFVGMNILVIQLLPDISISVNFVNLVLALVVPGFYSMSR
jgi:hypothetical protein